VVQDLQNARALGDALLSFLLLPWSFTLAAYTVLHWTYPHDRAAAARLLAGIAVPVEGTQRMPEFDFVDFEIHPIEVQRLLVDGLQSCSADMHANLPQLPLMQPSVPLHQQPG
jgi:hypothetical protein